jgi:hypothetical protein
VVGKRSDGRIGMFRQTLWRAASFVWSDSGPKGGLGCSDFCGEHLPLGRTVSGPMCGLGRSDSVLW